jgi:glycosyltransferase involved in cell wall biosynthesis
MRLCFLDKTKFKYDFNDKYSPLLRGAETTLINLSQSISLLGHNVSVFNNCARNIKNNNYSWNNINDLNNKNHYFDVAVANADTNLLNLVNAKKKIVISYSLQSIEKFLRKNQFFAYFKNQPTFFLLGKYHQKNRSRLISLFGSKIFSLGVDDLFIKSKINHNNLSRTAIFTSRSDRNLNLLLDIWKNYIYPKSNKFNLLITPNGDDENTLKKQRIFFRKMCSQNNLVKDLLESRMMLIPGHKAELYCLAAEEARELCLPIVTLGIGSLKERVEHGRTGLIAKNYSEFAEYTFNLFKNENLYKSIVKNLIELRGSKTWSNAAKNFISSI